MLFLDLIKRSCLWQKNAILSSWALVFLATSAIAQIPLDSWRTHFSYRSLDGLAVVGSNVYAFSQNGVFYFDATDNQTVTLSKQNGLTETGVSALAFAEAAQTLVVGYENGNVDLLKIDAKNRPDDLQNLPILKNSDQILGSKRINQIVLNNKNAFLVGDFGIALLDLARAEIRETYRNIGPNGTAIDISKLAIANDSIYVLTTAGLRAARFAPDVNLQFFGNWRSVNAPIFGSFSHLIALNNALFAAENRQVWRYSGGQWSRFLQTNGLITSLNATAGQLVVGQAGSVQLQNGTSFSDAILTNPTNVLADNSGNFWATTTQNGLVRLQNGNLQSIAPTGPAFDLYQSLNLLNQSVAALPGLGVQTGFSLFSNQQWQTFNQPRSVVSTVFDPANQQTYVASFDDGIFAITNNGTRQQLPNSPSNARALALDRDGNLWACGNGLSVRQRDGTWLSFGLPRRQFDQLLIDKNGFKWLIINSVSGGGVLVFDDKTNRSRLINTAQGTGGLPDLGINDIALDRDGAVWTATNRGVAVFDNPAAVFNTNFNAFLPVFERRRLFAGEPVTNVSVDGGNGKWFSTANGLFRFSPDASELLARFDDKNSPLPSNTVVDIAAEPVSGEVFFLTNKGIVSYRSPATEPAVALSQISIFPNPVRPEFDGLLAIKGLTENAVVKITDMAGRLVYETRSQGGTATWNLFNYQGRRAETGVYLVLVADALGNEAIAGKLAIVR